MSLQHSIYDPGYVNAMSHFYRGELGRIMVWRQRLDITTNWAITSSTAIITIAFSNREVPHIIFFFNLAIVWVHALDRSAALSLLRCFPRAGAHARGAFPRPDGDGESPHAAGRMEEAGLRRFDFAVLQNQQTRSGRPSLETELRLHFHPHHGGVGDEDFSPRSERIDTFGSFYRALRIGHIPSWLVAFIFAGTMVMVIGITIYVGKKTSGEISEFGTHRSLWRI